MLLFCTRITLTHTPCYPVTHASRLHLFPKMKTAPIILYNNDYEQSRRRKRKRRERNSKSNDIHHIIYSLWWVSAHGQFSICVLIGLNPQTQHLPPHWKCLKFYSSWFKCVQKLSVSVYIAADSWSPLLFVFIFITRFIMAYAWITKHQNYLSHSK